MGFPTCILKIVRCLRNFQGTRRAWRGMCPEKLRKKFEFYDMEIPNMPREPRPSWGNKIHFCRFLPFLPSAGAMTAASTAPSGHASAVQPPGRHVERRAWSWSGPLHLPWPSRALKMAKMWSDFGPAAALRGLGGGHDGHPKRHKRHETDSATS